MKAIRGQIISYKGNPFLEKNTLIYEKDGIILIENGKIKGFGSYKSFQKQIDENNIPVTLYSNRYIISPGFIDAHVHYPQISMIAAYGKQLVDWLNKYTFITEQKFENMIYARNTAQFFLRECLRAGTTTSFVYSTVHPHSTDVLFEEAFKLNMRLGSGKVMMDRNAPERLIDTAQKSYDDSKALIQKWQNKGRLMYCITPRFAPTSTEEQLQVVGTLWKEFPECYMQTHLSENIDEIKWVNQLFPNRKNYLDVYDHYDLVKPKSVFGHAIHLSDQEINRVLEAGVALVHCPSSNSFLGSGLFVLNKSYALRDSLKKDLRNYVALGTDLGAGTSFSLLKTLDAVYKTAMLNNINNLNAEHAYFLPTLGSAQSLYLEDKIGSFENGKEADFIVIDLESTPFIKFRMNHIKDIYEALFVQMILADDRAIYETHIAGECLYRLDPESRVGIFLGKAKYLNEIKAMKY